MKLQVTLNVYIDTEEDASVIKDRLASCDWDSLVSDEINDLCLDEFGEVDGIDLECINEA